MRSRTWVIAARRSYDFLIGNCRILVGPAGGRKCFWSQLNNSKAGKRYTIFVNGKLIGTHVRAIELDYPRSPRPPNSQTWWLRSPPLKFQPTSMRSTKMSIEHISEHICCMWSDVMNNITAFVKASNYIERRSSTICCGCDFDFTFVSSLYPPTLCLRWRWLTKSSQSR